LIHKEKTDEARRVENERQAVLRLWKEKEEEVGTLRDELERWMSVVVVGKEALR
jgi:hypothetical protein